MYFKGVLVIFGGNPLGDRGVRVVMDGLRATAWPEPANHEESAEPTGLTSLGLRDVGHLPQPKRKERTGRREVLVETLLAAK